MTDGYIFVLLIAIVGALVVAIAKLAAFFARSAEETRHICYEMERADSYEEYCRWRGELRCHYLCLIPFVNKKNVMGLYNRIYHRADKEKKERKDSLVPLLLPSIFGIALCMVCMCGMTWAWYTASIETPTQKMTAACYEVTVDSVKHENVAITAENGGYNLTAGTPYTVVLKADGSVQKCGGYCLIENKSAGTKVCTETIMPGKTLTVTFTPSADGIHTFTGVWGSNKSGVPLLSGDETPTEDTTEPATDVPNNDVVDNNTVPVPDETEPSDPVSDPADATTQTEPSPTEED